MHTKIFLLALYCFPFICIGQNKSLILKGRFENSPEKELYVSFYNPPTTWLKDTIHISESGEFYLETFKCEVPQKVTIENISFQLSDLMVAPGYELNINGDATNHETLSNTLAFSGIGASVNNYRFVKRYSIPLIQFDSIVLKDGIKFYEHETDSIINTAFNNISDPYTAWFKKLEQDETLFNIYNRIFRFTINAKFDRNTFLRFISNNIPDSILKAPGKYENLMSNYYKDFLNKYCEYLIELNRAEYEASNTNKKTFILKKIIEIFDGSVREFLLYDNYSTELSEHLTIDEINSIKQLYDPIIDNYLSIATRQSLEKKYNDKINFLQRTKVGMPAPLAEFYDQKGVKHNLTEFLGKVIYIDFWASWCGPCRAENPKMRLLYQRFKNDKNLVILGINVNDTKAKWLKALDEDEPEWLQFREETNMMSEMYNLNFIPKFAIIDKKGNIVTIDGPSPSEDEELIKILNKEMVVVK